MNIVIIGGAGFIGSNLIQRLKADSDYNLLSYDLYKPKEKVPYVIGDILNKKLLRETLKKTDVVYLKAGMLGAPACSQDHNYFNDYLNTNIVGVFNILEACKKNNVKKIIFDSSVSVYGENEQARFAQEDIFPTPRNLYGFSKVNAERLLKIFCDENDIDCTILRYSRVRSSFSKDVIYHFLNAITSNDEVKIFGDPLKEIEFVDIDDVVNANILALTTDIKFAQFNISSETKVSLLNLLNLCANITQKDFTYKIITTNDKIEPIYTKMDISLAKEHLGYIPKKTLIEILENTYKYLRTNNE